MFWNYTLRELFLICDAYVHKSNVAWEHTRNIEFANYNTQYNPNNGKKIFKFKRPSDLYRLPCDNPVSRKPIIIDKERQRLAVDKAKRILKL